MREEYREWWKPRFSSENRHCGVAKTIDDPSLHLALMDLDLVKKAFGRSEQVSTI